MSIVQGLKRYLLGSGPKSTQARSGVCITLGQNGHKSLEVSHFVTSLFGVGSSRRSLLTARAMDFITSVAILPLVFGCLGVVSLVQLLQRMCMKAYLRDAVVVVTGATSGLGRGGSHGQPAAWEQPCCTATGPLREAGWVAQEWESITALGPWEDAGSRVHQFPHQCWEAKATEGDSSRRASRHLRRLTQCQRLVAVGVLHEGSQFSNMGN